MQANKIPLRSLSNLARPLQSSTQPPACIPQRQPLEAVSGFLKLNPQGSGLQEARLQVMMVHDLVRNPGASPLVPAPA